MGVPHEGGQLLEVRLSISYWKEKLRCGTAGRIARTRLGSHGPTVRAKFTRQATLDLAKPGYSRIFYYPKALRKSQSCRNLNLDRWSPIKQSFHCRRLQPRPRLCSK